MNEPIQWITGEKDWIEAWRLASTSTNKVPSLIVSWPYYSSKVDITGKNRATNAIMVMERN